MGATSTGRRSNSLRPKQLAFLQNELNAAYGYAKMALTWPHLTKLGLVKKQEARSHWSALKKGYARHT